jgi:membrane associated rhomboid family serine protease
MLIIPITGNLSWRNPPWLTLLLILLNTVVFFGVQGKDQGRYEEAFGFYMASGLARMEVDRYRAEKGTLPPLPRRVRTQALTDEETLFVRAMQMRKDSAFMARLEAGDVIRAGDPDYSRWRKNRDEFNTLMASVVSVSYGYRPAVHNPITLLTAQFLHGGFGHLIGNMIFLWLFGCMLEMGLGRCQFIAIYLISGSIGYIFFGLFDPQSTIPLVGASGAIAGLMGALPAVYGRSKITFFFTSGFFFANLKLPAIALLPLWLGKEIYSQFSAGDASNVAFMAHAGGILAGALLGWLVGRLGLVSDATAFEEPPAEDIAAHLERALDHMEALRFDEAKRLLKDILTLSPDHPEATGYLYNIEKHQPNTQDYHTAAVCYLRVLSKNQATVDSAHRVYSEYTELATSPKLPPDLYTRLAIVFSDAGHTRAAGRILSAMLKKAPDLQGLPTALLKLSIAYQRDGQVDMASKCRRLLRKRYPLSSEAQIAGRLLRSAG